MKNRILYLFLFFGLFACQSDQEQPTADMVLINGEIATVDEKNPQRELIHFSIH